MMTMNLPECGLKRSKLVEERVSVAKSQGIDVVCAVIYRWQLHDWRFTGLQHHDIDALDEHDYVLCFQRHLPYEWPTDHVSGTWPSDGPEKTC